MFLKPRRLLSSAMCGAISLFCLPASAQVPLPPELVRAGSVRSLTLDQVETFAAVVSETEDDVAQTLFGHPELIPVVAAAADARTARKRTAKGFITAGFVTLGAGLSMALYTALSAPLICFDQSCHQQQEEASSTADKIAFAGAAIGLALAIPGFVKMAKDSDTEVEAAGRYRVARPKTVLPPPREPVRPQAGTWPRTTSVSLLTFRF